MSGDADRVLAAARAEGRMGLLETEAMALARGLGLGLPRHRVAADAARAGALARELPGDPVIVKALAPSLAHKTELGAVRVVSKAEVTSVVASMEDQLADRFPRGFLIVEFISHDAGPAGEFLLGVRRTADFGPVVTLALGGVYTEFLAAIPRSTVVLSPGTLSAAGIEAMLRRSALGPILAGEYRGIDPPVAVDRLASFLARLLELVGGLPDDLAELECNPIVFLDDGPVALDAVARLGPPPVPMVPRPLRKMGRLLEPASIAIAGVSERMNPGRVILRNILGCGFPSARIVVVKPGVDEIDGCRCVPDLDALRPVDLLVLSVGAAQVPGLMERVVAGELAEAVVLIPGGVGEREGSEAIAEATQKAIVGSRTTEWEGPLVSGGNSLGITSVPGRYDTLFIPGSRLGFEATEAQPVAVVSQSGAFAIARLARLPWLRPRYLITVGNQIDLTVGDYMAHLAADPDMDVVACYVEGFRPLDGARTVEAARRIVERGGGVILYHAGRTPEGARTVVSHTASIAGDHAVATALAEGAGILVAETLTEFEDLVMLATLLRGRRVEGDGLGAVSNAGFECVAMADSAAAFRLPRPADSTESALTAILAAAGVGDIVSARNPLDLTPITGDEGFEQAVRVMLADPSVDVGVVGCVPMTPALGTLGEEMDRPGSLVGRLLGVWADTDLAWVAVVDGGRLYDPMAHRLLAGGIPVFRSGDRALDLFGKYCTWRLRGPRAARR